MDFDLSPAQRAIREAVTAQCAPFDAAYWLERDREGGFPHDFHAAVARDGWLGIAMPEKYGGAEACLQTCEQAMLTLGAWAKHRSST